MSLRFAYPMLLGLALSLFACGDDTDTPADAGSSGTGGRGGSGGEGGGGRSASSGTGGRASCREDKHEDALSTWCEMKKEECERSPHDLKRMACSKTCSSTGDCFTFRRNSCGGTTVGHVAGGDLFSRTYHYDGDDKLVGIVVQPMTFPCGTVRDYYGMQCDRGAEVALECDGIDAGTDAAVD